MSVIPFPSERGSNSATFMCRHIVLSTIINFSNLFIHFPSHWQIAICMPVVHIVLTTTRKFSKLAPTFLNGHTTAILYTASRLPTINMGRPFFWRHLPVPAWTIDLELRAAGNPAGSLTPPSCTPQNHSVPLITRCLNLPHVTSQCNVARDWVRYAPFCFYCDSRGRKWGPQHHRFITGPPTPPTKRQNGGLLSYIARWYISSGHTLNNVSALSTALTALRQ